jgi:hypothetical protein
MAEWGAGQSDEVKKALGFANGEEEQWLLMEKRKGGD